MRNVWLRTDLPWTRLYSDPCCGLGIGDLPRIRKHPHSTATGVLTGKHWSLRWQFADRSIRSKNDFVTAVTAANFVISSLARRRWLVPFPPSLAGPPVAGIRRPRNHYWHRAS